MTAHNQAVAAASRYAPRPGEVVDWATALWDSEGFEHSLVVLGSLEVITKIGPCHVIWDRRTGRSLSTDEPMTLGNTPMSEEQRRVRENELIDQLRQPGMAPSVGALLDRIGVAHGRQEPQPSDDDAQGVAPSP